MEEEGGLSGTELDWEDEMVAGKRGAAGATRSRKVGNWGTEDEGEEVDNARHREHDQP